jgi:hypothetical protein
MLSGISSISIDSSISMGSSSGSGCVSGMVLASWSVSGARFVVFARAVALASFFGTDSFAAAGLRPFFAGAGISTAESSCAFGVFAGLPLFVVLTGAAM